MTTDRARAELERLLERYVYTTPEDRAWWEHWRATRFQGRPKPWPVEPGQLELFDEKK